MKSLRALALTTLVLGGCYGSFGAFHKVHDWNGHATGNKVANSGIHALLWIVQVYELVLLGDLIIFNTVEFATGDNPFR
ncbi:MAG: DUF3332 family protein [Proteobacteria bacterium]|nr:DUF3332 family protein [Pseudomonadota bacterium]